VEERNRAVRRAGTLSVAAAAAAATRAAYRQLRRRPPVEARLWSRTNYAGHGVELYGGLAAAAGAVTAMAAARGVSVRTRIAAVGAALAAGACGAYDDQKGSADERGFATHLRALRERRLTSGGVKLLGIGAAGLAAGALLKARPLDQVLAGVVIAGTAHAVNLMDVAPGRAAKALITAGVPGLLRRGPGSVLASAPIGAAAAVLRDDLSERTMLGDAGAHALGAALGAGVALAEGRAALMLHAAVVVVLAAAGDRMAVGERVWNAPGVRRVDSWGRVPHPYG
jgi:UDP-N-acetylmuramyl pentapeptide phosphotransferase/UDP-N-acetylglucosamine-1-phosphate transferase